MNKTNKLGFSRESWPTIRVFSGISTENTKVIYQQKHPVIPQIGDFINYQYWTLQVWRVEHLFCDSYEVKADIYVDSIPDEQ